MKIQAVIDAAVGRFHMPLTEETQIKSYLIKALTAYQDLAGCKRTLVIDAYYAGGHPMPESFLALAGCKDTTGNFVAVTMEESEDGTFTAHTSSNTPYPITLEYFVHLAGYAEYPDKHIPNRIAGMIIDYLECLIAMDNDDRLRRIETAGKMDVSHLPSRMEHIAQKDALEAQFRSNREIISMFSIHPS